MLTQSVPQKRRNLSVETFSLFAVFFVVVQSLQYPDISGKWVAAARLMGLWVMPFFYVVGGYFFAEKNAASNRVDDAPAVDRLAWIFIVWSLIYFPVLIISTGMSFAEFLQFITTPDFIFLGTSSHLWFISSLLFGYLFVAFCWRNHATILLVVVSIVGLALAVLSGAYEIFDLGFKLSFVMPRHWLSIPFLYIGYLLFHKGRPNWLVSALMVVFGAALQILEAQFLYDNYGLAAYAHQFLIGSIPFGIGMAGLALSDLKYLQQPALGKWGGEYSLGIYLIHPLIGYLINMLIFENFSALLSSPMAQAALPVILFVLSLLVLAVIRRSLPALFDFLLGMRAPAQELA